MKLTVFLLLLGILRVSASTYAQTYSISLDLKNATRQEAIEAIKNQTKLDFFYSNHEVNAKQRVTVNCQGATLEEALQQVLGFGYSFRLVDNMVVIRPSEQVPEERKITGAVKDKEGNPLPGVAVVVKGTTVGTATDVDGNYTLHLPEGNYTLVFSMLGMKVREELVGDRTEVNIVMEEDTQEMDEVVVTGIFKKARESYTGAVTTITDEELEMHRGQNLLQTLKNIDVSLNFRVDNLAGSDPNAKPSITIRGSSSLPMSVQEFNQTASNAVNEPLIIMDGFEISLDKLMDYNDEEIESINILKDAAATAIYGSRGANGVIVIITKKPEAGKLKINAEVGLDMEIPDLMSYDLLTAREKLELEKEVGLYDIDIINNDMTFQELYNERLHRVLSGATTDWISKPIRTGVSSHYNLRLDGGSDQFRWGVSLGYRDVAGAMKGSYRRSFNGSITLIYDIKNLTFQNYLSYGISRSKESEYGVFSDYVKQQPYNSPYDEHGNVVHLGDRDCSLQRRNQKMLEESPSPAISEKTRKQMGEVAVKAAKEIGYYNAGTIEFLVDKDQNFYFMEMNTRIQVEHPVTELVTGIDMIKEQLKIASGEKLSFAQKDITFTGHSMEVRVNAENPRKNFMPCPGKITELHLPGGNGIRVDTAIYAGYTVPQTYDSMLAKIIVHANTREECIQKMKSALGECVIEGIDTNIDFLLQILENKDFVENHYDTSFIEKEFQFVK